MGSFVISPRKNRCTCFSCGASYDPVGFMMNYGTGMTYPEALRYLASKFSVPIEGEAPIKLNVAPARQPLPDLPTLTMPIEWVGDKMQNRVGIENPLMTWLRALPWQDDDERQWLEYWLQLYLVGTSTAPDTKGWTIWWQVDEKNNVRTGKLMKYKSDGHRDKDSRYNFNFIHSILLKQGRWSRDEWDVRPCLFGLHLLDCLPDAEVCIVESEKTAIIAQTLSEPGKKIFMATGSKQSLTRAKLQPIIDRKRWIIVYPDVDGMEEWTARVKEIGYSRMTVTNTVREWFSAELDSPKADIADILIRLMRTPRTSSKEQRIAELRAKHPGLNTLMQRIPCEVTQLRRTQPLTT